MDAVTGRFAAVPLEDLRAVASAADAAQITERMLADLRADPAAWENGTLERFLEALACCLRANTGGPDPAVAEWRLFAEALVAATGYE
ncbi:hypothetical protein Cs7R123_47640 [Catellatospora sp. TT07R-123]|uniref:DUF7660 family protein n=1 Tax=Catellatospora sp. TT07R-123 TaxID=2733863 RepID=UPI001B14FE2C|nr:hypothetical protein [Catellatospora sp. TT07R-123]GHJ47422.1 hypothetical protein Cs7R123_47640 [Catellatospora sp. TT07R-123]